MARKKIPSVTLEDIEEHCSYNQCDGDGFAQATRFVKPIPPMKKVLVLQRISTNKTHAISVQDVYTTKNVCKKVIHSPKMYFDRVLDMHGMRVRTAYTALLPFIQQSYSSHAKAVLIITGKGKNSVNNISVLKESVLTWLREYPFREVVDSYGIPHRKFGGEGAIAVILQPFDKNKCIKWNMYSLSASLL